MTRHDANMPTPCGHHPRSQKHQLAVGEFIGTTLFLFMAFAGSQIAFVVTGSVDRSGSGGIDGDLTASLDALLVLQRTLYVSVSFGLSLMVAVWVFWRISGGVFNPAVSLASFHPFIPSPVSLFLPI